jgi:integrase
MRAWLFQAHKRKAADGDKSPWSVGWYDAHGKRKEKKIGSKSLAEKFRRKVEGELAAGLCTVGRKRTTWADFRGQYEETAMAGKAPATVAKYGSALDNFERLTHPIYMDTINTATIDLFKAKRAMERAQVPQRSKDGKKPKPKESQTNPRRVAPATVNRELRHLRAVLRKAWRWGIFNQPPDVAMLREPERDPYFIDDDAFKALYDACDALARPAGRRYPAADWWRALLCFAYVTGWRIGEILDLRRADVDLETGIATVDAESTKGRRTARVELHPVIVEHLRAIVEFQPFVFDWPHHERTLWEDFTALKTAAGVKFPGAFHRLRFGFANANVDHLDADLLQKLMRHQSPQTTRGYINAAARLKRSDVASRLHVPAVLRVAGG